MKYVLYILIALLSNTVPCVAEPTREQKFENNARKLKRNPSNTELLKENGFLSLNMGRYDETVSYADRLMKLSHGRKDSLSLQANAHILLGQAYLYHSMIREALDNLEKGKALAEKLGDHDLLSSAYNGLGIYSTQGRANPEQGIVYYSQALAHADSAGNELKKAVALYNLGGLWLHRDNSQGKRYVEEAFRKASALGDSELAFHACTVLAGFFIFEGKGKEAGEWLTKARGLLDDTGTAGGETYLQVFEAETAQIAKDYKTADKIYGRCMENIHELTPAMRTNLCSQYGMFLLKMNRTAEGIKVLEQGLREAGATKVASDSAQLINRLAWAYHTTGDNAKAYTLQGELLGLMEQMRIRDEDRSYMEYSVKTDMYLDQLQLERQKSQLLSKERNLILAIGTCLLLAVSCGLLFHSYRRKNRLYKSIVAQNRQTMERERILRERIDENLRKQENPSQPTSGVRDGTGSDEGLTDLADQFALLMIEERLYENPEITVSSIAERLGTNRTYLSKAINRSTGHSFSEVVTQYRIRRAAEILSDQEDTRPLKGVAAAVGFSSISTFYAAFRNQVGMTPAQYRKNSKEIANRS